MPKIKITEIDNTGSIQLNPITNVVFIPGKAASKMTKPVLCSSVSELSNLKEAKGLIEDTSYKLAKRLIQLGMQVLYQGFVASGTSVTWYDGNYFADIIEDEEEVKKVTISGEAFTLSETGEELVTVKKYRVTHHHEGSEDTHTNEYLHFGISSGKCVIKIENLILETGDEVLSSDFKLFVGIPTKEGVAQYQTILFDYINNKVGYNWLGLNGESIIIGSEDWALLQDKSVYDIRFLTTGGYAIPSQAMVECAATRGDCVALIDHDRGLTSVSSVRSAMAPFVSSFSSGFTPWFEASLDGTESLVVPASFGYLFAYARSIQNNPTWYSVAGSFRGIIPELVKVEYEYSSAEVEMLQGRASTMEVGMGEPNDNVGFAINPIAYVSRFGYLIWGNRTLVENEAGQDGVGILKATSFLNVRNLCSDIKKTLYLAARRYTFEQNSNLLWLDFKSQVTPLLDRMVSGNGIEAYTFEQMPTDKKARLSARLTIVPIEGVEDFELEVYLEDSLEVVE